MLLGPKGAGRGGKLLVRYTQNVLAVHTVRVAPRREVPAFQHQMIYVDLERELKVLLPWANNRRLHVGRAWNGTIENDGSEVQSR